MTAYDRLVARFRGQRPKIDVWSPTQYRVSLTGWHLHDGACTGEPFADGKTLEMACEALLTQVDAEHVELVEGDCSQHCTNLYTGSPKSKLAGKLLWQHIEKCAAEVARWPAWKRGLAPCASCDMAYGHPGECE